jgi:hypothetical protein
MYIDTEGKFSSEVCVCVWAQGVGAQLCVRCARMQRFVAAADLHVLLLRHTCTCGPMCGTHRRLQRLQEMVAARVAAAPAAAVASAAAASGGVCPLQPQQPQQQQQQQQQAPMQAQPMAAAEVVDQVLNRVLVLRAHSAEQLQQQLGQLAVMVSAHVCVWGGGQSW